ncbi:MAG: hypothetical protein AAF658_11495 [Myxococcota bacterium]
MNLLLAAVLCAGASSSEWGERSRRIPSDPAPEEITRGLHYVRTDEARHDLFKDRIDGVGGLFVGVGTSQNYLMAAWAEADHLIIVDFDEIVVHVHDAYRALFLHADSPEHFLELWRPRVKSRREAFGYINDTFRSRTRRLNARRAMLEFGKRVHKGLEDTIEQTEEQGQPCFLTDATQFEHLQRLFREDKVLAIRGDFTGQRTMRGIARMLKQRDQEISVLYLSNVEQYIGWSGKYRRNMKRLPMRDDSVVLRTYGWGEHRTADHNYRYYVQPGLAYLDWLRSRQSYVAKFLRTAPQSSIVGYHEIMRGPTGRDYSARLESKQNAQARVERQAAKQAQADAR